MNTAVSSVKVLSSAELVEIKHKYPNGKQIDPINSAILEIFQALQDGQGFEYPVPDRDTLQRRSRKQAPIPKGDEGEAFLKSTRAFLSSRKELANSKAQVHLSADKTTIMIVRLRS